MDVGTYRPGIEGSEGLGGAGPWGTLPIDPARPMLAVFFLRSKMAKTPPIPAATATAMNIAANRPAFPVGW